MRGYSGGMRRRLDVAAALLHRPEVLFLDEPTTGLDPESRFALWDSVRDLARSGTTVLLTTQYLEEADALADQVVIISAGRVADTGTTAELKARFGTVVFHLDLAGRRPLKPPIRRWPRQATGRSATAPTSRSGPLQAAAVPVVFLLVFTSAAFVPAAAMPGWLQAFGTHQPVDALVNAERALILGGPAAHDVLISLAWSGGLLVVFALLAARIYARMGR